MQQFSYMLIYNKKANTSFRGATHSLPFVPLCIRAAGLSAARWGPTGATRRGFWWWDRKSETRRPGTRTAGAQSLRGTPGDLRSSLQRRYFRRLAGISWASRAAIASPPKCAWDPGRTGSSWRLPGWGRWAARQCLCPEISDYFVRLWAALPGSLCLGERDITWGEGDINRGQKWEMRKEEAFHRTACPRSCWTDLVLNWIQFIWSFLTLILLAPLAQI